MTQVQINNVAVLHYKFIAVLCNTFALRSS